MWHFDIYHDIYSADMNRRITICKRDGDNEHSYRFSRRRKGTRVYTLYEEWHTPNSQGNTGDFDYYTFMTYQDAAVFIANLAIRLNSLAQNVLMRAAEVFATRITKDYKDDKKQLERKQAQTKVAKPVQATKTRHVYIFDMGNGTVKIGISKNVAARRNTMMHNSGLFIGRWCYTNALTDDRAFLIESRCHVFFKEHRTLGEFFRIPFADARAKLSEYECVFDEEAAPC